MQLIPFLLVGCVAAVVAQLPPRPEQIPGAEPVREPAPQRLSQYRRPTHRAYQDQPQQQQPERVIRVRRPTSRGRHVAVPPQPKQDYVSLTPRPVSEDPDSDFDAPAPPPPTRGAVSGRVLANRPLYLQPAVYRNARPTAPPALQGGFRPLANEDDNAVLPSRPSSPSPRAYLPGTGPNAPSGAPAGTAAPLLDLPLPDPPQQQQHQQQHQHQQQQQQQHQQQQHQHQQHQQQQQQQQRPVFRGPPAPLTAIPAAQLQLAQQLAQQQQHAVHQVQQSSATSVSPSASPSPASVEDDDEEEDNDAVSNPNRRQSLQSLTPFKVTPGNFLVTPSTLELDDDLPQSGFTPSVPRRPQQQPQVFRPSPILDLDNNAFSPAPRPQPPQQPQHQQIQRRPSPPPPAPAPATPSPARRPVLFRPERVNQVSPAPAPNVHVHQLLREDDDYLPVARPTPAPRPVRPQPTPQPQPRPVVKPRPPGNTGNNGSKYQRDKKPVAQVLRRYREDNPDGSITWGYENDDGSFKEETIGVDCMVRGKYGYIDPDGNRREYTYQSGIPCTPAPPGQQADDQEGGYIDYQNNQYVLPNGDAIDLDNMVKNRKRKPVAKNRNFS